jgi:tripartite-type tricarboxylate transporter receptor subunit TctC
VPYAPGGGSDQQTRRLQASLEDVLGVRINVVNRTGGDGSVGWNALKDSAADGCTIANVVLPNIANLSIARGDEVGFDARDYAHLYYTEFSPNFIAVSKANPAFTTFQEYVEFAQQNPGRITIAGVGANGALLAGEVMAALGIDLTYVPVSGGVGDIVPQVAGGSFDSTISGSSLFAQDLLIPLVQSVKSAAFPDIPSFDEAGYPGVSLVTSWGFIAPPGTPDDIVAIWNKAIDQAMDYPDVVAAYAALTFDVLRTDTPAKAREYFEGQYAATELAISALK